MPEPHPWLSLLGFDAKDRVVVVHVDDAGLCDDSNRGAAEALGAGANSCSVMVPCPGFGPFARRARSAQWDVGVHLTLTSEWPTYRWGPLTAAPSLRRSDGTMWADAVEVQERAELQELRQELQAQVRCAVEAGLDVTHLDTHMYVLLKGRLFPEYERAALELRVPWYFLSPRSVERLPRPPSALPSLQELWLRGLHGFDGWVGGWLDAFTPQTCVEHYQRTLLGLEPGLYLLGCHPTAAGAEICSFANDWDKRVAEHAMFTSGAFQRLVAQSGVQCIGMRQLRDALRSARLL